MIRLKFENVKNLEVKELGREFKKKLKENGVVTKGISVTTKDRYYGKYIDVYTNRNLSENENQILNEVCSLFSQFVDMLSLNGSMCRYEECEQAKEEAEIKYQEYLKEQEKRDKELEEKRKQSEILYNENVKVSEIKNAIIKNVEDKNIFVIAAEPSVNKNDWKIDNDKYIDKDCYMRKYKVTDIVELTKEEYNYFCFNLLSDHAFLQDKGGNHVNENGKFDYGFAVAIVCKGEETLIIDPQGYSYARYTCRLTEDINGELEKVTNSKIKIKNEFLDEEIKNIKNNEIYVYTKDMWSYMLECIKNDTRFIYNGYDKTTYTTGLALKEMIKEGKSVKLPLKKLRSNLENLFDNLYKIQKGISFSIFPTDIEKELLKINFLERLEKEIKRISNNPEPPKPTKKENQKSNLEMKNSPSKVVELESYRNSKSNLEGLATKRQLYALYCMTKIVTTNLKISKQAASDLIKKNKKGIDVKQELKKLIENQKLKMA